MTIEEKLADPSSRFLFLNVCIGDDPFTIASVYGPNVGQLTFLENTLALLDGFASGPIILGGDLNIVTDPTMDCSDRQPSRSVHYTLKARRQGFAYLLQRFGLLDARCSLHTGERDYSYYSALYKSYSRIDYVLLSAVLGFNLLSANLGPKVWSDHAGLDCQLWIRDRPTTRLRWRLNTNLLNQELLGSQLEEEIKAYFEINGDCGVSSQLVWDAMKMVVRGKAIAIEASYRKEKRHLQSELLSSIKALEFQHKATCNAKVYKKLLVERKKLEAFEINQIQRNIFYLKQRYWLHRPKQMWLLVWKVQQTKLSRQVPAICDRSGA